ncbi:MAG: DUF1574 domain-containing protein [Leptospira sp.]|nr:DUF1574 domain-containing protein [Leptospira sp.]
METFLTNRILFIPLLLAIFLFLFDKLFGLQSVRKYTETRIEFSFYDEKKALLDQLKNYERNRTPKDRLLILFGTSHMGEFSTEYIYKKTGNRITTYNFSAPMAPPSYLYYYLEKIQKEGVKIDYAVFETIPDIFLESANNYAIKFSYDWEFMFKNRNNFSAKELEAFSSANLFDVVRFPFRPGAASKRIFSPGATDQLEFLQTMVHLATIKNNGGIPNPIIHEVPESALDREGIEYYKKTFAGYRESATQKIFYSKFLSFCKANGIKLLVYKPFVSRYLETLMNESGFYRTWLADRRQEAMSHDVPFLELGKYTNSIRCKKFVDVHHLSGGCYNEITDILLESLPK